MDKQDNSIVDSGAAAAEISEEPTSQEKKRDNTVVSKQELEDKVKNDDVAGLTTNKEFCQQLMLQLQVGLSDDQKKHYRYFQKYVVKIRAFLVFIYLFILPFIETPSWCLDAIENSERWQFSIDCQGFGKPVSRIPKVGTTWIGILEFICLSFFAYSRMYRSKFLMRADELENYQQSSLLEKKTLLNEQAKIDKRKNQFLFTLFAAIMIDLGFALWMNNRPILSAYVRPLVVGTFMKSISENFFTLCKDLRDASVVLAMIFTFLAAYSLICFFFYQGSYGGFINFSSMTEAYYRLLILLTTANFPDIMLPAYEQNFWNCLLFISFLVVGLYFLMNVLLANVYSKFKVRLQSDGVQNMIDQERYLNEYLDRFDLDNNGIMEPGESKSFYEEIFNFDVRQSRVDYDTLQKVVIDLMDPRYPRDRKQRYDPCNITKQEFLDFFLLRDGYRKTLEARKEFKKIEEDKKNKALVTFKSQAWHDAALEQHEPLIATAQSTQWFSMGGDVTQAARRQGGDASQTYSDGEDNARSVERTTASQIASQRNQKKVTQIDIGDAPAEQQEMATDLPSWRVNGSKLLQNVVFNGVIDLANISFNVFVLASDISLNINDGFSGAIFFAFCLNGIFLLDIVGNVVVFGWLYVFRQRQMLIYEFFLQVYFFVCISVQLNSKSIYLSQIIDFQNVFMLRNLRLIAYCREIQDVELIYQTSTYLTRPIMKRFFFLYVLYYMYAQIAMALFGGKLTFEKYNEVNPGSAYYYLLNFNDFFSAFVVMFQQMVLSGWWVVVDMTVGYSPEPQWFIRSFFISFWVVCVLLMVNIIIAIVLEIHERLSDVVDKKFVEEKTTKDLHEMLKDDDRLSMRHKLKQARMVIEQLEADLRRELAETNPDEMLASEVEERKKKYGMVYNMVINQGNNVQHEANRMNMI